MRTSAPARYTIALAARIPAEGVVLFQQYEDAVLPLLADYGGMLERRLQSADGTREVHIVSFPNEAALQSYRGDPRRAAQASLLQRSGAEVEVVAVSDVA